MAKKSKSHSELRTLGREAADKTTGCLMSVLGGLMLIGGIIAVLYGATEDAGGVMGVGGGVWVLGLIFSIVGYNRMQKARHVAWTREAIERDRDTDGKELRCPRCQTWNPIAAGFCGKCGLALKVRCPSCGATNGPGSQFCTGCGKPL